MADLVDSSGWLEYFVDGPNAASFAEVIETANALVVPTIVIYEVFKRVLQQRGEAEALTIGAFLSEQTVARLTDTLAVDAARLPIAYKLPMADSIILATARAHGAALWTQDSHFKGLPTVHFIDGS